MAAKLLALLIYLLVSFYGMAESSRSLKFTPEVDLFESHPRLIQRETSIGNKSYLIQPYVKQFIKLSCLSTQPIRWVLYTYDPFEESPKIEKTQRKQGNTMRFESYISWTFTFRSTNVSDASCFYERDWKKYQPDLEIFSRTFGPTVVFRKVFRQQGEKLIPSKTYFTIYNHNAVNITNQSIISSKPGSCRNNLTIDLTRKTPVAVCGDHHLNAIEMIKCPDLDICDSLFLRFTPQDWVTCKGDFSSQPIVSANNSLSLPILPEPISVQCGERKLGIGSPLGRSFITLFPSFENNSWQSRIYYKTFEDAIAGNSIRVTLSKTWLHDQFHNLNFSSNHLAFAINETVEFACLAVKYLYMEGFHWKLGQTKFISADTPWQVHAIDTNHSLHVIRRNITLQGNVSGNTASSLSCLGPIWNSMNFQVSQPLNFDLHGPQAPSGSLAYSTIDDTHDEFTFIYRGWPKPTVTWFFSGNVTEAPSNQKPKDSHRHIYSITWNETRLLISQCSSYNVICHLKNFEGEVTQGVFRKKKICIMPILLTVPPAQPSSDSTGIIIGSSIGTLFIFIVILLLAFVIWRRKFRKIPRSETMSMTEYNTSEENQYFNTDFELSIKDCSIDRGKLLGSGTFGTVHEGIVKGSAVAIKQPNTDYSKTAFKSILCELKVLSHLGTNENVVGFIGAYIKEIKEGYLLIAIELCTNGSLECHLRRKKSVHHGTTDTDGENGIGNTLCHLELYRYSLEIASGMCYIRSKNVIHGDLATRNVLLNHLNVCKITDFGLSRKMYEYQNYVKTSQEPLPWKWMAYESLTKMEFTSKSDMWSFGVTLWEIFSLGSVPYGGLNWTSSFADSLLEGLRLTIPRFAPQNVYDKMLECWDLNSDGRPTFSETIEFFKSLCNAEVEYTELN